MVFVLKLSHSQLRRKWFVGIDSFKIIRNFFISINNVKHWHRNIPTLGLLKIYLHEMQSKSSAVHFKSYFLCEQYLIKHCMAYTRLHRVFFMQYSLLSQKHIHSEDIEKEFGLPLIHVSLDSLHFLPWMAIILYFVLKIKKIGG